MADDFMPLSGWDYLELWVGNAKQAAYFYEHALGFTRTAYAGPETGMRDRASYVLEQGEVRFVLTSALREDTRSLVTTRAMATASRTSPSPFLTRPRRTARRCRAARAACSSPGGRKTSTDRSRRPR